MNPSSQSFTVRRESDSTDDHVSAFRTALALFGAAELSEFLPPPDDGLHSDILCELVLLELANGWKHGKPTDLDTYLARYPELAAQPVLIYKIACEEFLLRRQAGESPSMAEYRERLHLDDQNESPTARLADFQPANASTLDIVIESPAASDPCDPDSANATLGKTRPGARSAIGPGATEPRIDCKHFDPGEQMPKIGEEFLDFFLLGELGRGAFSKVFLAQQGHLAGRLVALKIAMGLFTESQTLAQLQHTHIVPIYSYHHGHPFQAVCMPYLGSTTLAHVLADLRSHDCMPSSGKELLSTLASRKKLQPAPDSSSVRAGDDGTIRENQGPSQAPTPPAPSALLDLEGLSYVDSILWLAVRLTDGLAHAHERGIIHRDLKPANILITDDGMPMLLDFNLAHDTKVRGAAATTSMGGTLPYMSPEHLAAFHGCNENVDSRSDVYSLGVILFELLTGVSPFPTYKKPSRDIVERMIVDRKLGAPRLRPLNANIPPAVEAIVLRCLHATPASRYQTARQLQEDLQRQLEFRPLKHAPNPSWLERLSKFRARHPRATSMATVSFAAFLVIVGLTALNAVHEDQRTRLVAQETHAQFRDDAQTTYFHLNARTARDQLEEGERSCRAALARYRVLDDPGWRNTPAVKRLPAEKQQQLQEEAGQLLVLLAHAQQLAGESERDPERRTERFYQGLQFCSLASTCFETDQAPQSLWKQRGELHRRLNDRVKADECFERARKSDFKNVQDRFLAARLLAEEGKFRDALALVQSAIRLSPQDHHLHFLQGICHDYLAQHKEAAAQYGICIALRPDFFGAYYNRGLSHLRQGNGKAAIADLDQVLQLKPDFTEANVQRALAYQGMGKNTEAIADLTAALDNGFAQTRVYFLRARLREKTKDLAGAKSDLAEGFRREPTDELSWVSRGLAFLPAEPKRALSDFNKAIDINPRSMSALQNKAHVLAKYFKQTKEAVQVLDRVIELYPDDARPRAGRGVYLARLGKMSAARRDAEDALMLDTSPPNLYQVAGIYALTSSTEPDDQKEALRLLKGALKEGFGHDYLEIDRDLDPLRELPTFRRVIEASRALRLAVPVKRL